MKPGRPGGASRPGSAPQAGDTADWDGPALFQLTDLIFDAGDKANASLYLCEPIGNAQAKMLDRLVGMLRARGLWSEQEPKRVRDDQRQAYQDQLVLVGVIASQLDGALYILARFDHPRFPSSGERFDAWKTALAAECGAAGLSGKRPA